MDAEQQLRRAASLVSELGRVTGASNVAMTGEEVRRMSDSQIRQNPALAEAFLRGWQARGMELERSLRSASSLPPGWTRRNQPACQQPDPSTNRTGQRQPPPPPPPMPQRKGAPPTLPLRQPIPTATAQLQRPQPPTDQPGPSGTGMSTAEEGAAQRRRAKNKAKFAKLRAKVAARAAAGSQQHRLDKPTGESAGPTADDQADHPTGPSVERMEFDPPVPERVGTDQLTKDGEGQTLPTPPVEGAERSTASQSPPDMDDKMLFTPSVLDSVLEEDETPPPTFGSP